MGLYGCGRTSDDSSDSNPSPYAGIAIAGVAQDYTSSSIYYQGLKEGEPFGELKTILTGESGDPWLRRLGDKLYLFNRTPTSSNYRTLDPKQGAATASTQIRTEGAGFGDPHAALLLDESRLLLAHYTASKLLVINPNDGSVLQEITADWDFGDDAAGALRATALYKPTNSQDNSIYVLHQGRKADFSGYNNTQQLFVLKDSGTTLEVIDTDSEKARIQGIKLNIFNPQIIVASTDPSKPIVGGFCTSYDKAINPCTSGFEKVDLNARQSTLIYTHDFTASQGNGDTVTDGSGKFYSVLVKTDENGTSKSFIQSFEPEKNLTESYYEFADENYASYALALDNASKRIYAGEKSANGTGLLTILNPHNKSATPTKIELPLIPYKIEFIP